MLPIILDSHYNLLFCKELGFEIIDSGLDNPIVGRFSQYSADYLREKLVPDLYCHSSIIVKKIRGNNLKKNEHFDWQKVALRVSKESMYPKKAE